MTDIDITQDIVDGSDGALADTVKPANQFDGVQKAPPGTQPVFGDAKPVNQAEQKNENTKELSLRDQLSSAFKDDKGEPVSQDTALVKPQAVALTQDAEGKYRLADGTFASAEQIAAAARITPETNTNNAEAQLPTPVGLTPTELQQFQSLPAELRTLYGRTMEDLNTRAARFNEYDLIEQQIIGPRRTAFQSNGTTPAVALNQLFALSDFAGRDPAAFVMWFADQQKLDLDVLLDERDAKQTANPEVRALQEEIQSLKGTVQTFQQSQTQNVEKSNYNEVEQYATETDNTGKLLRPYLTDVMDDWATHIQSIRTTQPNLPNKEVLERAYQNACWSNAAVRGKMQAERQVVAQTNDTRVAAAKLAGSSVTGAPSGEVNQSTNNANRSLRDELETAFAQSRAV